MAKPIVNTTLARSPDMSTVFRSPITASTSGPSVKVRMTLERSWRDVDQQFFEQTGRHLMSSGPRQKAGVMEAWQLKYENDDNSETARKHKQMADVIQTVLDGVEVIGAFAAQAASTVFAPAGMCFNAMAFLIDAPRQIRKVYDSLRELFAEVSDFLVKFKILKRIDDEKSLDEDLIMNTNKVLMSFVRICVLSIHLLEGSRLRVAAKAIFLKDDSGVSAELEVFRRLTQSQSMLTGTVTLEHVLRSEQDVKLILASSVDTNVKIASLAAASSDQKTRLVNRERLTIVGRKLFSTGAGLSTETSLTLRADMNALPETLEVLKATAEWREWMDQTVLDRRILGISGPSNTGKSFLLEALKEKLDSDRQDVPRNAPSIYVGHYNFNPQERSNNDSSYNRSMSFVLKSIAFQVASQSTTYARELERHLQGHENVHAIESLDKLWPILGLYTFPAPADSVLFVLLDNVDQEGDGMVKALLEKLLDYKRQSSSDSVPNVRVRVFVTATTIPNFNRRVPELNMQDLNKALINAYITRELKRLHIFQDRDRRSVTRRLLVQEELPKGSAGRFNIVRQKLEMLHKAIHEDAPEEELSKIIQANIEPDEDRQSQQVLERLQASLQPQHIEHLNTLLMWTAYCQRGRFKFTELEAALYLSNGMHTLEPLVKKIRERFREVFVIDREWIDIREPVMKILKRDEDIDDRPSSADKPLFSLCISLQNAPEKDIRRFIWDLNEEMVSGKFKFSHPQNSVRKHSIKINQVEAHLRITKSCLKLLNEGPQDATQALLEYARDFLPKHLTVLRKLCDHISPVDRTSVSQGLIQYLSDPYYLEYEHPSFGDGKLWIEPSDDMDSICFWLEDPTTVAHLQPREWRWVKRAKESKSQAWFMIDVAAAVARKWSGWNHPKLQIKMEWYGPLREMYQWLQCYITANSTGCISANSSSILPEVADTRAKDSIATIGSGSDERTSLQQATEVVDWVQARLNDHSDVRRSMLIGAILYFEGEWAEAAEYFSICLADADHKRNALIGLGSCKQFLGDTEAYRSTFEELVTVMRLDKESGQSSQDDLKEYMNVLKELAISYTDADEHDQALRLCEDALKENEFDNDCRWMFVRSLCKAGRKEQLLALLYDWTRDPRKHGGKSPPQSFFEWTEDCHNLTTFNLLLYDIQDEKLLSRLAEIVEEAAAIANTQQSRSYSALLFCQGLANILSHDNSKLRDAIDSWEELTQTPQPTDPDVSWTWGWFHVIVNDLLVKYKFDDIREMAQTEVNPTPADVEKTVAELRSYIKFIEKNFPPQALPTPGESQVNSYVASTYVVLGRKDLAQAHTGQDMANHLEIMSDDDPDNDSPAIREMFKIFCLTNDVTDAMSAWFLLDHSGALWDHKLFPMGQMCSLCQTKFEKEKHESRWICKFCLSETCPSCHREWVVERTLKKRRHFCNPNHDFVEMRRWDYTEEEKAPGKVRIDFETNTDENGHQTRVGGRVVDISEWLEQVRVKWGLPPPSSTTRAQK